MKVDGFQISSDTLNFSPFEDKNISIAWQNYQKEITQGEHEIRFLIFNENDYNSLNNEKILTITVFRGKDLIPITLNLSDSSPDANQTITLNGFVKNFGDVDIDENFLNCFYYDSIEINCFEMNKLNVGEIKEISTSFDLPSYFVGTHSIGFRVDVNNSVQEYGESNNEKTVQINSTNFADLFIDSSNIIINPPSPYAKQAVNVLVDIKNIGGFRAENVLVRVYKTQKTSDYLLLTQNFSLINPNQTISFDFNFTPQVAGTDSIIVEIDPFNLIYEENKANNEAIKVFDIMPARTDFGVPFNYTLFFDISKECVALFSNGDRFISNGLIDNNGLYYIDFKWIDSTGLTLVSGIEHSGFKQLMAGRTIEIVSVSDFSAKVLLVFNQPIGILFSTCEADIQQERLKAQIAETDLKACTERRIELETKYDAIDSLHNSCEASKNNCETLKSTLETNLSLKETDCQQRLSLQSGNDLNRFNKMVTDKDSRIAELSMAYANLEQIGSLGWVVFFVFVAIAGLGLILYTKKIKGGI